MLAGNAAHGPAIDIDVRVDEPPVQALESVEVEKDQRLSPDLDLSIACCDREVAYIPGSDVSPLVCDHMG